MKPRAQKPGESGAFFPKNSEATPAPKLPGNATPAPKRADYGRLDVLDDSKFGDEFKEEARTRKMTDRAWLKDASERILGRQLSDKNGDRSAGAKWRTQLASGASRDDIMDQMIKSDEYQARDAAVKKYRVEKGGENPEEKWLDARVGAQGWKDRPGGKYTVDTLFDSKKSPNLDNKDNPPIFGGKEPEITLPEVPPKGKETQPGFNPARDVTGWENRDEWSGEAWSNYQRTRNTQGAKNQKEWAAEQQRKSQEQASGGRGGNWVKGLVKGVKEATGLTTSATSDLNREKEAAIKQGVSQNELREMEQKHRDGGYSSTPSRGSIERGTFKPSTNTFTPRKRVETPDYSYQETNKAKSDRGKDFVDKFTSGYSGLRSDSDRQRLLTGNY